MKFLTVLLLNVAFIAAAQAKPAVGDQAVMKGQWHSQTVLSIQAITEYSKEKDSFKIMEIHQYGSNPVEIKETWKTTADLEKAESNVESLYTNCVKHGLQYETIVVQAGTFAACKNPINNGAGAIYFGIVPFHVLRSDFRHEDGTISSRELVSFQRGKQ